MARSAVWFRNDLRLHDHDAFRAAISAAIGKPSQAPQPPKPLAPVIPIFVFDVRQFGKAHCRYGHEKTGLLRAKFLIESVQDLRNSLRRIGTDLVVRVGKPEVEIAQLVQSLQVKSIHVHEDVCSEERDAESRVENAVKQLACSFKRYWGSLTMYHKDDIDLDIDRLPDVYTHFRKHVESRGSVRRCQKTISSDDVAPLPKDLDVGEIPTLLQLGFAPSSYSDILVTDAEEKSKVAGHLSKLSEKVEESKSDEAHDLYVPHDKRAVLHILGGETQALKRVQEYIWDRDCLKSYKETRNGMLGADYSSKFSLWLWNGCVSPRYLYWQVQQYEQQRVANESTYWLLFELEWRDYFKLVAVRYGTRLFWPSGLRGQYDPDWCEDQQRFDLWKQGRTGYPLVDANMRELAATGFMSNRGRQNVASFLCKDMLMYWYMGAEYFEQALIDYDPCSNYGNWQYVAGIGNDPRENRKFNVVKQARDYDLKGDYLRHWLPELARLPADKIHEPWKLTREEQVRYGVIIGQDYPRPICDPDDARLANGESRVQGRGRGGHSNQGQNKYQGNSRSFNRSSNFRK